MKYNAKITTLLFLSVSIFFSNNMYSRDNPSVPENNFSIFTPLMPLAPLFNLLQYFWQSINNDNGKPTIYYVRVPKQDGADCGPHAVKNGMLLKFLLESGITNKQELEKFIHEAGFPQLEDWRAWTQENFGVSDWLDDQEVSAIAEHKAGIEREKFTTIPNIHGFNPVQITGQDDLLKAISQLNSNENFQHIFFIGNMREQCNARGHWIEVSAQRKNGKIDYYVTDSLGGEHPEIIEKLRKITESNRMFLELQQAGTFENLIETTKNRLHNLELRATKEERISGAIKSLEKIEQHAVDFGLLSNPTWRETYHNRVSRLVDETAKKAHGINDEAILKKLQALQYTFCE